MRYAIEGVCDKGFIWNPSVNVINLNILVNIQIIKIVNAEKKLTDKLIDECTEIIEETKLAAITPFENKNNSCKVYITLMIVAFKIFIGITVYLICYSWSLINNNYYIKFNNSKRNKNMMIAII